MVCPKCGKPNSAEYIFCISCGTELLENTEEVLTDWNNYTAPAEPKETVLPPVRKIGFREALKNFFTLYASFKGRATLREFWFAYLFILMIETALFFTLFLLLFLFQNTDIAMNIFSILSLLCGLAFACPLYALIWRRLHDVGKSGAFYFLGLIPIANIIVAIYIMLIPSDGDNKYRPRKVAENSGVSPDLYS